MKSLKKFLLIILPLIAFSLIFTKNYKDIPFTNYEKNVCKQIIQPIDEQIGNNNYLTLNNFLKEISNKKQSNDEIELDCDLVDEDKKVLNKEIEKNYPGPKISIHPSFFSGGSESNLSWLMTRPPHLVSNGQGQGY